MVVAARRYTSQEFEAVVAEPENVERLLELIEGEIIEVVSNSVSSRIAARIIFLLLSYLEDHPLGEITGADGGYVIGDEHYIPDVAFAPYETFESRSQEGYVSAAPALVAEVISPTDMPRHITIKLAHYLEAGVHVWLVYPDAHEVHVYVPGEKLVILRGDDTLTDEALLPGFATKISDIFKVGRQ